MTAPEPTRPAEWAAVPLADEDHERWEQVTA